MLNMIGFVFKLREKEMAKNDSLYAAFAALKNQQEFNMFMADLCTPTEIRFLNERWRIAKLLRENRLNQKEIAQKNKFGRETITRVARCLNENDNGGYNIVLDRVLGVLVDTPEN
jgi:TrpR-related protein YerC/YecD